MALVGTFTKQPNEILDFDIDFGPPLTGRSDTIQGSPTATPTPAGLTVVSTAVQANKVKVIVSGGTDAQQYKVTVVVNTTAGLRFEDEVTVNVEEV